MLHSDHPARGCGVPDRASPLGPAFERSSGSGTRRRAAACRLGRARSWAVANAAARTIRRSVRAGLIAHSITEQKPQAVAKPCSCLLPLTAHAWHLPARRRHIVRSATRLPQEPAELDDWLKPYAGADDFRAERQQQLAETASDLEITFLGTASCVPSVTRGVSCTALRYDGATYLFDAGEATQVQAQRTTLVKPGKVEAIFVTHLHGDHTFGLPGLLCLCGQDRDASDQPIEIFGPEGLRAYVRASLQLTQSRVAAPHVIHELVGVPQRPPAGFRARAASKLFFCSRWRVDGVKPGPGRVDGVAAAVARSWGIDAR